MSLLKSSVKIALAAAVVCALPLAADAAGAKKSSAMKSSAQSSSMHSGERAIAPSGSSRAMHKDYGMMNPDQVRRAQQALNLPVTGRMTEELETAILNHQISKGLPATGRVDSF
jgi:hypothetical protein